jgi:hypothetical protein
MSGKSQPDKAAARRSQHSSVIAGCENRTITNNEIFVAPEAVAVHHIAIMQKRRFEIVYKGRSAGWLALTAVLCAVLAAFVFLCSSALVHALTPLRDSKDTALLEEAKAACAGPNFPRFLRAFASSQIVRNAYTEEEVQFATTVIDVQGRQRTITRMVQRLAFRDFPLRFQEGRYVLAPGPTAQGPSSWLDEAKLQFLSPRRIVGQTVARWGVDRGRVTLQGHESARHYGYRGELVFVGDRSCWKLIRVRAIVEP